jgi:hypothetical protein
MTRIARVGVMKDGRGSVDRLTGTPRRAEPTGTINTSDHDSRIVRTQGQPAVQGYNAQAAVNEEQIVIAAEVTFDSSDIGHLEPMVEATIEELERLGPANRRRSWWPTPATGTSSRWRRS